MKNRWSRMAAWGAVLPLLLAMDAPAHRFHRPIEGAVGWTSIELPDDVLDAARPGLADVRVALPSGEEVPYALGALPNAAHKALKLIDVEQSEKETTAIVDRGTEPQRADAVELLLDETDFIKPVSIDASNDRTSWRRIGRGSIFAAGSGARVTRIRFAPSDHRYWRLSLDDRNGPPLKISEVIAEPASPREEPRRTLPLEIKAEPDAAPSTTTFSATLPSRNLKLTALRLSASDAAFARRVRVFERVWFRDEVSRRLLGEGEITQAPGGGTPSSVPLGEATGKQLEIDIERPGGVPLHDVSAEIVFESRVLHFHAPEGSSLELVYGSPAATLPSYDLAAALRGGAPTSSVRARLGEAIDTGEIAPSLPTVLRGAAIDRAGWKTEQPIVLPPKGPLAYLDVERGAGTVDDLRIVDRTGQQVPYLVEKEPRHARYPLDFDAERKGKTTRVHLQGLTHERSLEAIELEIAAPAYFTRQVTFLEPTSDDRGATAPRQLGTMRLVKTAEQPTSRFRIPVISPLRPNIEMIIDDGDNAPLEIGSVSAEVTRRRLNFVFEPGDELTLLSDNDAAPAPAYDLALIAQRVLAAPAVPATLGEIHSLVPIAKPPTPAWFWIFVLAAAVILLLALARTLTAPPAKPT